MLEEGFIHIYCGEGKGKTTAALGLCFRALGAGLQVRVFQFMKRRYCSEHKFAEQIGLEISRMPESLSSFEGCRSIFNELMNLVSDEASCPDLIVLDELGEALKRNYISREDVELLCSKKPLGLELVFTGRGLEERIGDLADLISSIENKKHYFEAGVPARKGIEF